MINSSYEINIGGNINANTAVNRVNPFTQSLTVSNNQSLVLNLQKIWANEKFSKELLKYEDDFISEVLQLTEKKEKEIAAMNNSRRDNLKEDMEVLELDVERIKFLVKDYLRIRLCKIDKYLFHIIKNDLNDLLSNAEFKFAFDLFKMKRGYFSEGLSSKIPETFSDFKPSINEDMIVQPPKTAYVCFKSLTYEAISVSMKDLYEDSNDAIIINKDDIYSLPMVLVRDKLEENKVQLI